MIKRTISAMVTAAFILTQCGLSYALRPEQGQGGKEVAQAIGTPAGQDVSAENKTSDGLGQLAAADVAPAGNAEPLVSGDGAMYDRTMEAAASAYTPANAIGTDDPAKFAETVEALKLGQSVPGSLTLRVYFIMTIIFKNGTRVNNYCPGSLDNENIYYYRSVVELRASKPEIHSVDDIDFIGTREAADAWLAKKSTATSKPETQTTAAATGAASLESIKTTVFETVKHFCTPTTGSPAGLGRDYASLSQISSALESAFGSFALPLHPRMAYWKSTAIRELINEGKIARVASPQGKILPNLFKLGTGKPAEPAKPAPKKKEKEKKGVVARKDGGASHTTSIADAAGTLEEQLTAAEATLADAKANLRQYTRHSPGYLADKSKLEGLVSRAQIVVDDLKRRIAEQSGAEASAVGTTANSAGKKLGYQFGKGDEGQEYKRKMPGEPIGPAIVLQEGDVIYTGRTTDPVRIKKVDGVYLEVANVAMPDAAATRISRDSLNNGLCNYRRSEAGVAGTGQKMTPEDARAMLKSMVERGGDDYYTISFGPPINTEYSLNLACVNRSDMETNLRRVAGKAGFVTLETRGTRRISCMSASAGATGAKAEATGSVEQAMSYVREKAAANEAVGVLAIDKIVSITEENLSVIEAQIRQVAEKSDDKSTVGYRLVTGSKTIMVYSVTANTIGISGIDQCLATMMPQKDDASEKLCIAITPDAVNTGIFMLLTIMDFNNISVVELTADDMAFLKANGPEAGVGLLEEIADSHGTHRLGLLTLENEGLVITPENAGRFVNVITINPLTMAGEMRRIFGGLGISFNNQDDSAVSVAARSALEIARKMTETQV